MAAGAVGTFALVGVVTVSLAMVGSSTPSHGTGAPRVASDTGAATGTVGPATKGAGSTSTTTTAAPTTTTTAAPTPTTTTTQPTPAIGAPAHGVCPSGFCYTTTTSTTTTAP